MNKKGFTLVELLGVIIILGVITTIGTTSVFRLIDKMKLNTFKEKVALIVDSARTWGDDNRELVGSSGTTKTLNSLITEGYISKESATNNVNGGNIGGLEIRIYRKNNRMYACITRTSSNNSLLADNNYTLHSNYYC